jgi:hypothetical protein
MTRKTDPKPLGIRSKWGELDHTLAQATAYLEMALVCAKNYPQESWTAHLDQLYISAGAALRILREQQGKDTL